MEKRTYRYSISWWFIFGFLGSLCIWSAIYMSVEIPLLVIDSSLSLFKDIALILLVMILLLFGIFTFAAPLTSKIILSTEGIEFHTLGAVTKSRWTDVTVGILQDVTGKNITLHLVNPEIKLRSWTRYAPWDAKKGVAYNGIPVSQFGGFAPQKLIDEIQRFAPNLRI